MILSWCSWPSVTSWSLIQVSIKTTHRARFHSNQNRLGVAFPYKGEP
jgi:hypothetical protein